jgi:hypothetical protein
MEKNISRSFRYGQTTKRLKKAYRKIFPVPQTTYGPRKIEDICAVNFVSPKVLHSFFKSSIKRLRKERGADIGDYLEFGVYNGTSLASMYLACKDLSVPSTRFFGFDAFEGLPPDSENEDGGVWRKGFYKCTFEQMIGCIEKRGVDPKEINWVRGWTRWFGDVSQNGGILTIKSDTTSNGSGALLQGTANWEDYTFNAKLDWVVGQNFGLVGRYNTSGNYLVCEFSQQAAGTVTVLLNQHLNNDVKTLAIGLIRNYNELGGSDISASIQVKGDQVSCGFNYNSISTIVAGTRVDNSLLKGGIGFTTYDPIKKNSEIDVKSVGVALGTYYLGPNTIQGEFSVQQQTNN